MFLSKKIKQILQRWRSYHCIDSNPSFQFHTSFLHFQIPKILFLLLLSDCKPKTPLPILTGTYLILHFHFSIPILLSWSLKILPRPTSLIVISSLVVTQRIQVVQVQLTCNTQTTAEIDQRKYSGGGGNRRDDGGRSRGGENGL